MPHRTAEQRCRDIAREHGWSDPLDEGEAISCSVPDGMIVDPDDLHGRVVSYEPYEPGDKNKAWASLSDDILNDRLVKCTLPHCC